MLEAQSRLEDKTPSAAKVITFAQSLPKPVKFQLNPNLSGPSSPNQNDGGSQTLLMLAVGNALK